MPAKILINLDELLNKHAPKYMNKMKIFPPSNPNPNTKTRLIPSFVNRKKKIPT
jgi:hypothetical protein